MRLKIVLHSTSDPSWIGSDDLFCVKCWGDSDVKVGYVCDVLILTFLKIL